MSNIGVSGKVILASATVLIVALVGAFAFWMSDSESTHRRSNRIEADTKYEDVKLPEELSAEFGFIKGWWVANGPADDKALKRLASKQRKIDRLRLNQTTITPRGLEVLRAHEVNTIDLTDTDVDAPMLEAMSRLPGLKTLMVKEHGLTDEMLKKLTGPESIECLLFKNAGITSFGIKHLPTTFPNLKNLIFINCKNIDDSAVPIVISCQGLDSFNFMHTSLSTDGVNKLAKGLPLLQSMSYLGRGNVDELITSLKNSKVEDLWLNSITIGDEKSIDTLCGMKKLRVLVMMNCTGLTRERLARLNKELPKCQVVTKMTEEYPEVGLVEK